MNADDDGQPLGKKRQCEYMNPNSGPSPNKLFLVSKVASISTNVEPRTACHPRKNAVDQGSIP